MLRMQKSTRTLVGVALIMLVAVATAGVSLGAAGAGTASGDGQYGPPGDEYGGVDRLFGTRRTAEPGRSADQGPRGTRRAAPTAKMPTGRFR